jgi:hypothetical protein
MYGITLGQTTSGQVFKILSLDGGGIRGVFPAAFLAKLEEHLHVPIGSYFDLIAGTSTGGITAIGLGLGLSVKEILKLYAEAGAGDLRSGTRPVRELRPSAAARRTSPLRLEVFVRAATGRPHRHSRRAAAGRKPDAPRHPGMAPDAGARLHLQDRPSSAARDGLQGSCARRRHGYGGGADLPEAAPDKRRDRTRRRRDMGEQSDRRRRDRSGRHAALARRPPEDPQHRDHKRPAGRRTRCAASWPGWYAGSSD